MPRDIPVGNGRLLVTFDHQYQLRDIYFPHVGQENHAGAGPCRFGVYTDCPRPASQPTLLDQRRRLDRPPAIPARHADHVVSLDHRELRPGDVLQRRRRLPPPDPRSARSKVKNLAEHERTVKLMHHQDFNMFGTKGGRHGYYDPELKSIVHYRGKRYILVTFISGDSEKGWEQKIDEFACGTSGFHGAEGTWRDAEDGPPPGQRDRTRARSTRPSRITCTWSRRRADRLHGDHRRPEPRGIDRAAQVAAEDGSAGRA
jgi:GH15 family glucan-1,4-alpha-glucosidase